MLNNYMRIAFRNLLRNKTFSAINILGLAIGIASYILIVLSPHKISPCSRNDTWYFCNSLLWRGEGRPFRWPHLFRLPLYVC